MFLGCVVKEDPHKRPRAKAMSPASLQKMNQLFPQIAAGGRNNSLCINSCIKMLLQALEK